MTLLSTHRTDCRLCHSRALRKVISLAPTPPANAFVGASDLGNPQEIFPLDVYLCHTCQHIQLLDVVDPSVLFRNYLYVSGVSHTFRQHFRTYARHIADTYSVECDSLVVDIGSNDGTFLRNWKDIGARVLGIDPAIDIARRATSEGMETLPEFLTKDLAHHVRSTYGPAKIVTANNVFAHVDDLDDFLSSIKLLLSPDGVFCFEVSYFLDVYQGALFDTIYHEHLSYHTIRPLTSFFRKHDMELIKVERVPTHGGSIRGIVSHRSFPRPIDDSVSALVKLETELGLDRAHRIAEFGEHVDLIGKQLRSMLLSLRRAGHTIVGYGAPAKSTTLLHHYRLGPEIIQYIVDDSALKQGLFTPGYLIPILPPSKLYDYDTRPDVVLILAWNLSTEIHEKHKTLERYGARFIVPLPAPRIL